MKKILFVTPSLRMGGLEKLQVTLANKLAQSGYDVTVMTLDTGNDLGDALDSGIRLFRKEYKKHPGKKIPYIRHKLYDDGMWETRAKPEELYRYYVGDEKYDVEIAFFRGLSVKIISGSTNPSAVRLAWVHNDFRKAKGYQNNFRDMRQVFDAYAAFDHVVCVSEQARQGFLETIGDTDNTVTVYNMLLSDDIRRLSKEPLPKDYRKSAFHTVVVARLEDRAKGQKRLISAVAKLHDEGAELSLSIVGGGSDDGLFRQEIESKNASSYITLEGEQKNPYPYIAGADLLICASYYEGYNLTVAEALILGVPVLSTDCTGPGEILDGGKYGMIVENSEEGLYDGLKQIVDDPRLLSQLRDQAKQRQDFFREETILRRITDLFKRKSP